MNWKKTNLYFLLSFGFSWTVALIMGLAHINIGGILGTVILAGLYMPGPALATFIIQKFIYKEGFKQYGWIAMEYQHSSKPSKLYVTLNDILQIFKHP